MVLKLQQKTLNLVILEKRFALHVIVRISICYLSYVDSVDSALAKNLQNMHYNIKIEVIRAVIYTCMSNFYGIVTSLTYFVLQSLTKEWVDPVLRPTSHSNSLMNLPANRLRQRQREIALDQKQAALKQGWKKTPPKFFSAMEVFPQLKRRAQQGLVFSLLLYMYQLSFLVVLFTAIVSLLILSYMYAFSKKPAQH